MRSLDDQATVIKRQCNRLRREKLSKAKLFGFERKGQRNRASLNQVLLHGGHDLLSPAQLQESNVFNRLETIFLEHMSRHKVGKCAKAGHADSFSLERGDARDRRGGDEGCWSLIILEADHGEMWDREVKAE